MRAAAVGDDGSIDTDHFPFGVDQCAAGIALVDGGVRLDEILERCQPQLMASLGTDDALGDRLAHAEGITDGQHNITDPQLTGLPQVGGQQVLAGGLDHGQIRIRVGADHPGGHLRLPVGTDEDVIGILYDMVIGEYVPIAVHHDAGTEIVLPVQAGLAPGITEIVLHQRVFEQGLAFLPGDLAGVDVDHGRFRKCDGISPATVVLIGGWSRDTAGARRRKQLWPESQRQVGSGQPGDD